MVEEVSWSQCHPVNISTDATTLHAALSLLFRHPAALDLQHLQNLPCREVLCRGSAACGPFRLQAGCLHLRGGKLLEGGLTGATVFEVQILDRFPGAVKGLGSYILHETSRCITTLWLWF